MYEPDRMFLDPFSFVFFFLCVIFFLAGVRTTRFLSPRTANASLPFAEAESPFFYIGVPLITACILCSVDLARFGANVNFLALLLSQQGQTIKDIQSAGTNFASGIWVQIPVFLIAALWWTLFRLRQLQTGPSTRVILMSVWALGVLLSVLTSVAAVNRDALLALIVGVGLVYLYHRSVEARINLAGILWYLSLGAGLILVLFLALSFLRGAANATTFLITSLFSYSIASYNRFASILHGQMTYLYGGTGVYLFDYLNEAASLNGIFHYQELLHWPNFLDLYHSEFASTMIAGLNSRAIWGGVFGYLYADIGWGTLVYLYFSGIFTGYMWAKFKAGSAIAIVAYSWIFAWILHWNGPNHLIDFNFVHLVLAGIVLAGWDKLFLRTNPANEAKLAAGRPVLQAVAPLRR
jgi:hypothetical protein